ncbi:MAG: hypothetical protein R6V83_03245 [Candidatus Thorarchaeota archaeon]
MVSRSLEKMMLIAVGLSSAVIVGVPLLMHAINLMASASHFEIAQQTAIQIHNATEQVDTGLANTTVVGVNVPQGCEMQIDGNRLTITYSQDGEVVGSWPDTYSHNLVSSGLEGEGYYTLTIRIVDEVIQLSFNSEE